MRAFLVHGSLLAVAFALAACGGATPRKEASTVPSASEKKPAGTPRLDLHCTPQNTDDEAKCAAQGPDHRFGPPLVCRGTPVGDDVRQYELQAYEAGTEPCTCISSQAERDCMMVP